MEIRWDLIQNTPVVYSGDLLIYELPTTGGISDASTRENLTRAAYGEPPDWLSGDTLTQWYAARDPRRINLRLNFVPLSAYLEHGGLEANAPTPSGETSENSRTVMIQYDSGRGAVNLGLDWPDALQNTQMDIFASPSLSNPEWRLVNRVIFPEIFSFASWVSPEPSMFFFAAPDNTDSNHDGISDAMARHHFGLNPNRWSTLGGGISDRDLIFKYGLDPKLGNTSGDGYGLDEKILFMKSDPVVPKPGASASIRYYYDSDGRLTGAFSGENAGALTRKLSPANNIVRHVNHP